MSFVAAVGAAEGERDYTEELRRSNDKGNGKDIGLSTDVTRVPVRRGTEALSEKVTYDNTKTVNAVQK